MKFACPESQKRELLKCGNIASGSAFASLEELGGSFEFAVVAVVGVVCSVKAGVSDCAQAADGAFIRITARANHLAVPSRLITSKANFGLSLMRANQIIMTVIALPTPAI